MNLATLLSTPIGELLGNRKEVSRRRTASKPRIGSTICCAGLRMTVQAGLSDDLWQWLLALGWRELGPGENRLNFKALPSALVARLFDSPADERQRILIAAIRETTRPVSASGRLAERVVSM
jgi:hypothetical protein